MQTTNDRAVAELMEQLIETGPDGMATAFTAMLNLAMRLERERHVGAQAYERSPERSGYATGYEPKKLDTPAGTLTVQVPESRGGDAPFYPQSLSEKFMSHSSADDRATARSRAPPDAGASGKLGDKADAQADRR